MPTRIQAKSIKVDLDSIDLVKEGGFGGMPIVRIDFHSGGKRVTAHVSMYQHELRRDPTLLLTVVNKHKDVSRTVQIHPWTKDE